MSGKEKVKPPPLGHKGLRVFKDRKTGEMFFCRMEVVCISPKGFSVRWRELDTVTKGTESHRYDIRLPRTRGGAVLDYQLDQFCGCCLARRLTGGKTPRERVEDIVAAQELWTRSSPEARRASYMYHI